MKTLPVNYYHSQTYWAHMLTFRCPGKCRFCILDRRGKRQQCEELSAKEILDFWNSIDHESRQKLSLIGGEPLLLKGCVEVINNLDAYQITLTTNCKGPFFHRKNFASLLHPVSSALRINTTFHPHQQTPEEYIRIIEALKDAGHFVDQIAFVHHPLVEQFKKETEEVRKRFPSLRCPPYLGFYNEEEGFGAPFASEFNMPNEDFEDQEEARKLCGITDYNAYRHISGKYTKNKALCIHPFRSLIIGPEGNHYHCHYKLYYGIDPVSNIRDFIPVKEEETLCHHYGFCNWCDVPRVRCSINKSARPLTLNKLYNEEESNRREIVTLVQEIQDFAQRNNLLFDRRKWFEYAYAILYSGIRHRGKVLDVGSAGSVFPHYLAYKGFDVTIMEKELDEFPKNIGKKYGVKFFLRDIQKLYCSMYDKFDAIFCLSVIEHVQDDEVAALNLSKYLKPGGILFFSTDFHSKYIEYPDGLKTVVKDREKVPQSRLYTPAKFIERIGLPLERTGIQRIGKMNYSNIDLQNSKQLAVRGLYTIGIGAYRRKP